MSNRNRGHTKVALPSVNRSLNGQPKWVRYALIVAIVLFVNNLIRAITGKSILGSLGITNDPDIEDIKSSSEVVMKTLKANNTLKPDNYHEIIANTIYVEMNKDRPFVGLFTDKISSSSRQVIKEQLLSLFRNHVCDAWYDSTDKYQYAFSLEVAKVVRAYGIREHDKRGKIPFLRMINWGFFNWLSDNRSRSCDLANAISLWFGSDLMVNEQIQFKGEKLGYYMKGSVKTWFVSNPFYNANAKFDK